MFMVRIVSRAGRRRPLVSINPNRESPSIEFSGPHRPRRVARGPGLPYIPL